MKAPGVEGKNSSTPIHLGEARARAAAHGERGHVFLGVDIDRSAGPVDRDDASGSQQASRALITVELRELVPLGSIEDRGGAEDAGEPRCNELRARQPCITQRSRVRR